MLWWRSLLALIDALSEMKVGFVQLSAHFYMECKICKILICLKRPKEIETDDKLVSKHFRVFTYQSSETSTDHEQF